MGIIADEEHRKKCGKKKEFKPIIKKSFGTISSKIDTGISKNKAQADMNRLNTRQSNDLTAKRRDELFGRVTCQNVARFLTSKLTQHKFV